MKKALTKTLQTKDVNADILNDEYKALQKVVDKAAKEKIIHKNKASRIKARFAKKISAHEMASSKAKKQSK